MQYMLDKRFNGHDSTTLLHKVYILHIITPFVYTFQVKKVCTHVTKSLTCLGAKHEFCLEEFMSIVANSIIANNNPH